VRARVLKPGFFMNEDLARLPVRARLLFAGLWGLADREGRLEDRPMRIKAAVFPYERVNVDRLIQVLVDAGFVKRYRVLHQRCLAVPGFATHQHPHPKEPQSSLPPEPCNDPAGSQPCPAGSSGSSVPRSGKDQDQDQNQPAASRPVRFPTYAAIAAQVVKVAQTKDLGELAEQFKRACARQGLPYDATITTKALSTATRRRA
jgi:hypothetical protein